MKIIFASFLLIFSFQFTFAQEKPKAELVDEIGLTGCCDLSSRMHNVWQGNNLSENKELEFYLVIFGQSNILKALAFERLARGIIEVEMSHYVDKNRIKIIRTNKVSEIKIQFWLVQKNADISFLTDNQMDLSELKLTKPKLFLNSSMGDELCSTLGKNEHFSEILLANPELRGHIVIFDSSTKKFSKTEKELLNEFTEKLNIPRNQLRTFFIKQPKDDSPYYEFWLVPKRRK